MSIATTGRRFDAAHGASSDWAKAVKTCVDEVGTDHPAGALGFVYVTEGLGDDLSSVLAFLRQTTKVQHWVGAVGNGVCAVGAEYHQGQGMSVMVASLPTGSFRILPTLRTETEGFDSATRQWLTDGPAVLGVVHADPGNGRVPALVERIAELSGGYLVGGLTAQRAGPHQVADSLTGGGVSGVLVRGEVAVGLSQGCSPIGPWRTITEASGNVVMALDGRPALAVLKEDVGEVLARDLRRISGYIHAGLPIGGSDSGEYLVRPLTGMDAAHGWMSVGAEIGTGARLVFVRRDPNAAQVDLRRMVKRVRQRSRGAARGALYFSCVGRGPNMFGAEGGELAVVREELGDLPLTGFYANGEINNNRLHGFTGVLAVFL